MPDYLPQLSTRQDSTPQIIVKLVILDMVVKWHFDMFELSNTLYISTVLSIQGLREVRSGAVVSHIPPRDGNILLFDFNKPEDDVKKLNILSSSTFDPQQFNPHGISYWQDPDSGTVWLYVINHLVNGEAIEVFEYIPTEYSLKHIKRIQHPILASPNDLLMISPDSFYFTDDHYFRHHLLKTIEGYLQLPISSVGFYDGETNEARLVASSLKFPNGINMSPDGRYVED